MIGFDRFREIFNKIHAISDENSRNTILRSLNWFWMSLDNNLDVDNFLHLWIGVELLEPELKSHYGFDSNKWANPRCRHCKREFESCPNCSGDFTYAAGSGALGLKQVVADCGMKANLYRDLQGLRSKLVHAGIPIPQEIIQQAIVDTRELLTKAIFTLLDLDHTRTSGLSSIVRHQSNPLLFFFEGTMDVVDVPTIDDVHLQPTVYGRYDYNFEIDDHGDLVFRGEVEHEFQGAFIGGSMEKKLRVDSSLNVQDVWDES